MFIFQTEIFDLLLYLFAFFPLILYCFISANMNIFGREQVYYFCQDIFKEFESVIINIIDIWRNTPGGSDFHFLTGTAQFRIGCNSCHGMPGHFNFGYYSYIAVGSIIDYFLYFILCIEATVLNSIIFYGFFTCPWMADDCFIPPCPDFG